MAYTKGKYERNNKTGQKRCPYLLVPVAFLLLELFAFSYLQAEKADSLQTLWPIIFGLIWSIILAGVLRLLPQRASRIGFGILYGSMLVYAVGQTGYYQLFSEMMWLSDFRYASEGSDYLDILLQYPAEWFVWIAGLLLLGLLMLWKYPRFCSPVRPRFAAGILTAFAVTGAVFLPEIVFLHDSSIRFAKSDYGRMQSAEAAYDNLFNAHRLYQVCGIFQTAAKDLYSNSIYPMTPVYAMEQEQAEETIDAYFEEETLSVSSGNEMTGILKGKNVIVVLMESMDDWMIGDHTPTIRRLMAEGINFTNFYTPPYGGIRTFNTEFCINTGSFLSSQGGYAFDYVTNEFNQSLASVLSQQGYSAKLFHYNDPSFYSRDVFAEAMGYEEYVYYADYLMEYTQQQQEQLLYDDRILFRDPELRRQFFRQKTNSLNFVITRSAHLTYRYNEVLSHWGLKQYPQYRGLTGNEETDCALLKARLVDDFFAELLLSLEEEGMLRNTVIIGVTDHYTYGYADTESLLELSGVEDPLLLEKTPCFIWSADATPKTVDKILNTSDFLPTVLNLMGIDPQYEYIGGDAFDDSYPGYALFSDGSWICAGTAYNAGNGRTILLGTGKTGVGTDSHLDMSERVEEFTEINNLILETDYYE